MQLLLTSPRMVEEDVVPRWLIWLVVALQITVGALFLSTLYWV